MNISIIPGFPLLHVIQSVTVEYKMSNYAEQKHNLFNIK